MDAQTYVKFRERRAKLNVFTGKQLRDFVHKKGWQMNGKQIKANYLNAVMHLEGWDLQPELVEALHMELVLTDEVKVKQELEELSRVTALWGTLMKLVCDKKAAYKDQAIAKMQADVLYRETGLQIQVKHCPICDMFHLWYNDDGKNTADAAAQ